MSDTSTQNIHIVRQLREIIRQLVNVQSCNIAQANTVTAHTWTGNLINVYLLDHEVSTRAIKRILQDSTDIGVGTLFILQDSLLPGNQERFEPKEWIRAIHELTRERIYTYTLQDDGKLRINQTHLEQLAANGQYSIVYGPPLQLEKIRFFLLSVKQRSIRGSWQVADLGNPAFWKSNRSAYRPQYRRPSTGETQWKAWSQTTWDQDTTTNIPTPPQPRTKLKICYEMLHVSEDASKEEVKAAYRKLAIEYHPDTSELSEEIATLRFNELRAAYEYIKTEKNWK